MRLRGEHMSFFPSLASGWALTARGAGFGLRGGRRVRLSFARSGPYKRGMVQHKEQALSAFRRLALTASFAVLALGGAAVSRPAPVMAAQVAPLSDEDKAAVDKATAYLQDLKTVSGRFSQISANGATSTGQFYMQRPGKARFQYDPPAQMLVVSDGHNVSIYDQRLKSFDQYPLGSTPLVLLLAREVRLDRGVIITSVEHTDQGFSINARDARKQAEGRLTLNFSNEPVALKGWTIVDGQGQETRVRLGTLSPVSGLDPSLFTLRDPRAHAGRP